MKKYEVAMYCFAETCTASKKKKKEPPTGDVRDVTRCTIFHRMVM